MIVNIIVFIVVLSVLVLAHELGHFWVARWSGIAVEEFGIGYPPRIWHRKRGGVVYSINLLPLGGFVRLKGEFGDSDAKGAFNQASVWKRIAVVVAGVIMNILLAWVILFAAFLIGFSPLTQDVSSYPGATLLHGEVVVMDVVPNTPAAAAGIQSGDSIRQINVAEVSRAADIQQFTASHRGDNVRLTLDRQGTIQQIDVTLNGPVESPLGVSLGESTVIRLPLWQSVRAATNEVRSIFTSICGALWNLAKGLFGAGGLTASGDVTGPVGIYRITAVAASVGPMAVVSLLILFSINLAIINILPFPALDGGRLLLLLVEAARGKRIIHERVEAAINTFGFILLLLVIILLTYHDLVRIG